MSEFNYVRILTRCMLISAIALMAGVAFPAVPPIVFFIIALVPLPYYHLLFLRPRAGDGLNQAAIDSVYYYGFLITVGALGATSLELAVHGVGEDLGPVALQFGLGLIATGYAVWARVHLTASTRILDEEELRLIMSQQILRSRELLSNMELASSSFETFAKTLLDRTDQFSSSIETRTRATIDDAMKAFSSGITALSEQAQIALLDLRGIVNDVSFGAEREELRNSVTNMVDTVVDLSTGLEQLRAASSAGAGSVGEFAGSLESVNRAAGGAADKLSLLGRDQGVLTNFSAALSKGIEEVQGLSLSSNVAAASVTSLSASSSAAHLAVETVGKKASVAHGKLGRLAEQLEVIANASTAIERVSEALLNLGVSGEGTTVEIVTFQGKMAELTATLTNLNLGLIDSTGGLKDSMADVSEALETFRRETAFASEELARRPEGWVLSTHDEQRERDGATPAI